MLSVIRVHTKYDMMIEMDNKIYRKQQANSESVNTSVYAVKSYTLEPSGPSLPRLPFFPAGPNGPRGPVLPFTPSRPCWDIDQRQRL